MYSAQRRYHLIAVLGATVACAGTLVACGGSQSRTSQTASSARAQVPQKSHETPAASNADIGSASAQTHHAPTSRSEGQQPTHTGVPQQTHASSPGQRHTSAQRSERIVSAAAVQKVDNGHPGPTDDVNSSGARPLNPCQLVTRSQAESAAGGALVGSVVAPLGPTCIYHFIGVRTDITLAVEAVDFGQMTEQMPRRTPVVVGHVRGYCGRLGSQMLLVPLPAGEVLNVTAPCATAQRLATAALAHLGA